MLSRTVTNRGLLKESKDNSMLNRMDSTKCMQNQYGVKPDDELQVSSQRKKDFSNEHLLNFIQKASKIG